MGRAGKDDKHLQYAPIDTVIREARNRLIAALNEERLHLPQGRLYIHLAPAGLRKTGEALDLPLTREQIADYLGLTIETVSRQIGALKKEGVIDLIDARTLKLPKIDKLRMAAGEDV